MHLHRVVTKLEENGQVAVRVEYSPTVRLLPVAERARIIEEALLEASEVVQRAFEAETVAA